MSYATVDDFRQELGNQVGSATANDTVIQRKLNMATALIDAELSFSFGDAAVGTQTVYGDGTPYLMIPTYVAGSITAVTSISGLSVPDYIERDGMLIVVDADGVIPGTYRPYAGDLVWQEGIPYTVAATFGYADVPADIIEACLQIAIRAWHAKDSGFSDAVQVVGSDAVGYNGAIPNLVKRILDNYREKTGLGVW